MIKRRTLEAVMALALLLTLATSLTAPAVMNASTAQQGPKLTLKVYPDASVKWVGEYYNATGPSSLKGATVSFLANLTQLKKGTELVVKADVENLSSLSKAEAKGKAVFTLNINGKVTSTKEVIRSSTNFNLYLYSEESEIKIKAWSNGPVRTVLNRSNLYGEVRGNVSVAVSGSNAIGVIFALSLLNKGYIESQLAKSNVTYVDIKELKTTTSPSGANIVFDIGINYTKMIEEEQRKMNASSKPAINPEKLKKLLEASFIPYNTTYQATVLLNNDHFKAFLKVYTTLSIMEIVNITLNTLSKYAEVFTSAPTAPGTVRIHANITKGVEDFKKILSDVGEVVNRFEVLPSSAYISVNLTKKYVHVKFETFRIRAKGAKTPEDTLKALANAVKELESRLSNTTMKSSEGREVKKALDKVLGSEALIEGVGGVKVSQTRVPLSELGKVRVTVTHTASTTTQAASKTTTTITVTLTNSATTSTPESSTTTTQKPATPSSTTQSPTSTTSSTTSTVIITTSTTTSTEVTVTQAAPGISVNMTLMLVIGVVIAAVIAGVALALAKR